jgi:hypothetical protein
VGELELPQDEFGDVLLPAYQEDAPDLHEVGFSLTAPRGRNIRSIVSLAISGSRVIFMVSSRRA